MFKVRIEAGLSALSAALAVVTVVWPAWLETILPVDPDGGSGEAKWVLVMALALAAVGSAVLAARGYRAVRRLRAVGPAASPEL